MMKTEVNREDMKEVNTNKTMNSPEPIKIKPYAKASNCIANLRIDEIPDIECFDELDDMY